MWCRSWASQTVSKPERVVQELDSWKTALSQIIEQRNLKAMTISPQATVLDAVKMMVEKGHGSLAVVDETFQDLCDKATRNRRRLVGVMTERDYLQKMITQSRASKNVLVKDVMSHDVVWLTPEHTVGDALSVMVEHDFRHLPIVTPRFTDDDDDTLVAMVSMRDLMHRVALDHERQVAYLMSQLKRLSRIIVEDVDG